MKQERKGRNLKALGLLGLAALAFLAGCNGGGTASTASTTNVPQEERTVLLAVKPTEMVPGNTIELSGRGFPTSVDNIVVRFKSVQDQTPGIPGMVRSATANLVKVLVPTGVPTGLVTVSWRDEAGRWIPLAPKAVTGTPMLLGYYVPNPVRGVAGIVQGGLLQMNTPTLMVYGLNIDATVTSAELRVLSADRQSVLTTSNVSIDANNRGVSVPNVTDTQIRGVSFALPTDIGSKISATSVSYIEVLVRSGTLVSNKVEVPAVNFDWTFPVEGELPMPAFVSGCWINPGVQGGVLEIFYTVFQPLVRLKWSPIVEMSNGATWDVVPTAAFLAPPRNAATPNDLGVGDYQPTFVIPGTKNHKPEKGVFSGPGTTYRLLVDMRSLGQGAGQGRLRITLGSESTSHGELGTSAPTIAGRLTGNRCELPYFAASTFDWIDDTGAPVQPEGVLTEEFFDKEFSLDRDTYTGMDSTGGWGVSGVARGLVDSFVVTGQGTDDLDETILQANFSYLFDTTSGVLYEFPAGATDSLIATVRAESSNPTLRNLMQVFVGKNPGESKGELHVASLVVPKSVKIYARGKRAFVIRVSGVDGGLAAKIDGQIIVDGLPAGEGSADSDTVAAAAGRGGVAGPGGAKGGGGGVVRVRAVSGALEVGETAAADPGDMGGGAGQTIAYTLPEDSASGGTAQPKCFVYGGPGGGGGFGVAGGIGRPGTRVVGDNRNTGVGNPWSTFGEILRAVGVGGPARGSEDLLPLSGGSGGGGGGGWLARAQFGSGTAAVTRIFGVGGGGGGGGGGVFNLVARGSVEIGGRLAARGGNGAPGRGKPLGVGTAAQYGEWSGACGGGGSGGAILVQVTDSLVFTQGAELDVTGGQGGRPGTTIDPNILNKDWYPIGGDGGRGRVRLEAGRGVNLPSSVDLNGVIPPVAEGSTSTVGPILENVNGGTGVHGALDLGLTAYAGAVDSTFYIGIEENDTPVVYYIDGNGDRYEVIHRIAGLGAFNFTSLVIPEGVTLKGYGSSAIVIRVQGRATVQGTVDVSGADGRSVELAEGVMIPGSGGNGGPGGGNGGLGGLGARASATSTDWEITVGEDGNLPPSVAPSNGSGYVNGDPWNGRDTTGAVLPAEGGLTFSPALCGDTCSAVGTHQGGGGGGGGFGAAGTTGPQSPGSLFGNGAGGLAYGSDWFLSDGETTQFFGGSGGGGGGASTSGVTTTATVAFPGSGGGGGGGCVVFAVLGDMRVGPAAVIDAHGGDAFKAIRTGGSGGAGSGGAIFVRVNGNLTVEAGAVLTTAGGRANLTPEPAYPVGYPASTVNNGGDGAIGRVRIEYPGGGMSTGSAVLVTMKPPETVASVGTSFQGNEIVSYVWSKPVPLTLGSGLGVLMTDSTVQVTRAVTELVDPAFLSPIVRWSVLIDGGEAKCGTRPVPDRLFGPMSEFQSLNDVGLMPSYARFMIAFVSSRQTSETAEVDRIEIPWRPVDHQPAPVPGP